MKKTYGLAGLLLLTGLGAAINAHADEERWPRWYVGLSGGFTYMKDEDLSGGTPRDKISLQNGFGVGGAIGYMPSSSIPLINNMRFEGEVTYHQNGVDKVKGGGVPELSGSGNYSSTAYMFNAFYDFKTGTPWTPYIGGGVGIAELNLSTSSNAGNTSGHDSEFAYQGLVGVAYAPVSIPNTQWTLGYRYLGTSDPSFSGPNGDINSKYGTHSVEVGARLRF